MAILTPGTAACCIHSLRENWAPSPAQCPGLCSILLCGQPGKTPGPGVTPRAAAYAAAARRGAEHTCAHVQEGGGRSGGGEAERTTSAPEGWAVHPRPVASRPCMALPAQPSALWGTALWLSHGHSAIDSSYLCPTFGGLSSGRWACGFAETLGTVAGGPQPGSATLWVRTKLRHTELQPELREGFLEEVPGRRPRGLTGTQEVRAQGKSCHAEGRVQTDVPGPAGARAPQLPKDPASCTAWGVRPRGPGIWLVCVLQKGPGDTARGRGRGVTWTVTWNTTCPRGAGLSPVPVGGSEDEL